MTDSPSPVTKRARLAPIHWSDLGTLPKMDSLVDGLLDCGTMSQILGAKGTYKTFLALDIDAHVATGRAWRGREVKQGPVVYLAVEGGQGIAKRLEAWRKFHDVHADDAPFYVVPDPIDLAHSDADAKELIRRVENLKVGPIAKFTIDTTAQALAGADENSSRDLGVFIRNCGMIRFETGAHLMAVHHLGKDPTKGSRGHSNLPGALDTIIRITAGVATVEHQRDAASGDRFGFAVQEVELGDGRTSLVAVPTDSAPRAGAGRWTRGLAVFRDAVTEAVLAGGQDHRPRGDGPIVKAVTIGHARSQHQRLYVHGGDGDRAPAERQAWGRALKAARESNLIGGETVGDVTLIWIVTA